MKINGNNHQPVNKKLRKRLIIQAHEISGLLGRTDRTSRRLLRQIRIVFGKPYNAQVTVREFCQFYGMEEELVYEFISDY